MKQITFILNVIAATLLMSCSSGNLRLYRIQVDGKYGFIDSLGTEIIKPQYRYASSFTSKGYALVISNMQITKDSTFIATYGYIDKNNNIAVDTTNTFRIPRKHPLNAQCIELHHKYKLENLDFRESIFDFLSLSNNRYAFQDDSTLLWGYKDLDGNVVIKPQYEDVKAFHSGRAIVRPPYASKSELSEVLNCVGVIDVNGNIVVKNEYNSIKDYLPNGKTWASTISFDEQYNVIRDWVQLDKDGKIIVGPISLGGDNQVFNSMDDNYVMSCPMGFMGDFYTFIDSNGNYLTDYNHDGVLSISFDGEKAELEKNVTYFSDGFAGVNRLSDKGISAWLFVNEKMEVLSEPYDSLLAFSEGVAAVKELVVLEDGIQPHWGKWGFVDKQFKKVISYSFDDIGHFRGGLAWFTKEGNTFDVLGYINKKGEVVWQTKKAKKNTITK